MALKLSNNAVSKLASSLAADATILAVLPGEGSKYPTLSAGDWFPLTVVKSDGSFEIMRCTARATDTLTVSRAQEGTAALAFNAGDRVELRFTAAVFLALAQIDGALSFSQLTVNSQGNATNPFTVNGASNTNGAGIFLIGNGATTPNKTIRSHNGNLEVVNSSYSAVILSLNDAGDVAVSGSLKRAGNIVWDAGNFDPASKQAAGNYAKSTNNVVTFDWGTHQVGQLGLTIDANYQGYLWHSGNFNPANYAIKSVHQDDGNVNGSVWGGLLSDYLATQLAGKQASGNYMRGVTGNGFTVGWDSGANHLNFFVDGNLVGFVVSDERAKKNITPSSTDALARVKALEFVEFDFIDSPYLPKKHVDNGVIAQQAQRINPNWIDKPPADHPDAYLGLNLQYLLMDAMRAIQQLSSEVDELKAELERNSK
ncbi:phage tail fiber protein [Burkholderia phage Bcep22]|uniref:Phage tail fiber protein n=1 Tax=Burkholderia phage Bcep22 TaxID=2883944 RepID=Q6V7M9_9CAUD|nr:tail fiber protein [Burkholderia phage Bcep22]AAQ54997.1 phage tail fiber protein [Burkholderia phage Bcep22]